VQGERTHGYGRDPELEFVISQGSTTVWGDREHGTHLTINRSINVQTESTNYHAEETNHACEGVNLLNEINQPDSGDAPIVTDPYTVPAGKTAPNNPPFIVKRSDELPAGQKSFRSHDTRNRKEKGEDSQVETSQYVPEVYQSHY